MLQDIETIYMNDAIGKNYQGQNSVYELYTITLRTSSALTCLLRYVKLHTGYWGSSSNYAYPSLTVY
jgi:hypothetical protein